MSRRKVHAGITSVTVPIFVQDTTSTTVGGLGGLVYNTSGLAAKYRRQGDSVWTTITLVTATLGTFTSGGFVSDGGPVTGGYEVGVPDAAFASGARWVQVEYYGAANMLPALLEFELDAVDYQDATAFGLGRLDAAVSSRSTYAGADTSGTTTLLSRLTSGRAGNLDNLDVAVSTRGTSNLAAGAQMDLVNAPNATAVAAIQSGLATASAVTTLQASVSNLNNLSALANLFAPSTLVRPASGSVVYPLTFVVKDSEGHLIDVDSNAVTLTATNAAGTDRSANLSAVTHAGTGEYTFTYTVASSHADEGLRITAAGTVQSATRKAYANLDVADADSLSALAAIQAKTDAIGTNAADSPNAVTAQGQVSGLRGDYTTARAGKLDNLDATVGSRLAAASYAAPDNADVVTALADLVTLLGRTDPTTALTAVKAVTDKVNTMLQGSGPYAYTAAALANAPVGSVRQINEIQRIIYETQK